MRALSSFLEPFQRFQAVHKPQRFPVHLARGLNLDLICTSLKKSLGNFDGELEHYALEDVYVHAEEADPLISSTPSGDLYDSSIQHTTKLNPECPMRITFIPVNSQGFSTTGSVPRMSGIENLSKSRVIGS